MSNWSFSNTRLNLPGFRALRKSAEAESWVMGAAEAIASEASRQSGEEYKATKSPGRNRARAIIAPDTLPAAIDSAANLTLLKSMNAGRQ